MDDWITWLDAVQSSGRATSGDTQDDKVCSFPRSLKGWCVETVGGWIEGKGWRVNTNDTNVWLYSLLKTLPTSCFDKILCYLFLLCYLFPVDVIYCIFILIKTIRDIYKKGWITRTLSQDTSGSSWRKLWLKKTVSIIISQSCNTQGQAETCRWFYMKLSHQHMLIDYVPLHSSGCKHLCDFIIMNTCTH